MECLKEKEKQDQAHRKAGRCMPTFLSLSLSLAGRCVTPKPGLLDVSQKRRLRVSFYATLPQ